MYLRVYGCIVGCMGLPRRGVRLVAVAATACSETREGSPDRGSTRGVAFEEVVFHGGGDI